MYRQSTLRSANNTPPRRSKIKRGLLLFLALFVVVGLVVWPLVFNRGPSKGDNAAGSQANDKPAFDKTRFSTTDPASIWAITNKQHQLTPKDYAPSGLVAPSISLRLDKAHEEMQVSTVMAPSLESLVAEAKQGGLNLMLASGYRSYNFQVGLYNRYVKSLGQAEADKTSARPGHSEHQTGLAVDLEPTSRTCEIETCFADTPEGVWLAANAYKYGFIIRYTANKVSVTGYEYEPWHLRYVGIELATEMRKQNIQTLEEFFGLPAAPNY